MRLRLMVLLEYENHGSGFGLEAGLMLFGWNIAALKI